VVGAHSTGCSGWIGYDSVTYVSTSPQMTIVETVESLLEFDVDHALVQPGMPREYWKTVGSTLSWKATATGGGCSGQGAGTVTVKPTNADHAATLRIVNFGGKLHASGEDGPWPGPDPTYTIRCSNGTSYEQILYASLGFFMTDPDNDLLAPDGKSFSGNFATSPSTPANTARHKYLFRCTNRC